MTRPPVCGAGATFGLLMEEKERLRRIELEEGDGDAVSDERDRRPRDVVAKRVGRVNQGRRAPAVHRADALQERDLCGNQIVRRVSATAESWPPRHRRDVSKAAWQFPHRTRPRLRVLACLGVSEWRTAPPIHGVDVCTPRHQIFDRSEVPFGRAEVEGRAIVVVTSTNLRARVEQLPQLDDVAFLACESQSLPVMSTRSSGDGTLASSTRDGRRIAPFRSRYSTTDRCPPASASLIAVPPQRSFLFTSAPWQTRNSTCVEINQCVGCRHTR